MNKAVEVFKAIDFACTGVGDLKARTTAAKVANLLLAERAVRVGGEKMVSSGDFIWSKQYGPHLLGATHSALLICVEPITKDTAEGLLRELCQWASESNVIEYTGNKPPNTLNMHSIIGRARKLLDKQAAKG